MNIKEPTLTDMVAAILHAKGRLSRDFERAEFETVAEEIRLRQDYLALKRAMKLFPMLANLYRNETKAFNAGTTPTNETNGDRQPASQSKTGSRLVAIGKLG